MPDKSKTGWKNLEEKAAAGEYDLIVPLDYLILELLPEEGDLVMGYYPFTKTSAQLVKERFKEIRPGQLATTLSRLKKQGLVVRVRTRGAHDFGYQRTPAGKKLYESWKQQQGDGKEKK